MFFRFLDAALVSPGAPTPFPNPDVPPDLSQGMHALLGNNIWGTNYVMWQPYGNDSATQRFRFVLQVNIIVSMSRSFALMISPPLLPLMSYASPECRNYNSIVEINKGRF